MPRISEREHSDLATNTEPFSGLPAAQRAIESAGFTAEVRQPDAEDPLGGLIEVTAEGIRPIEVVNFFNPWSPRAAPLADEAIREALAGQIQASPLRVVSLPHLIALKLYAGGPRSRSDVVELLERNRPLDLPRIRDVCARHGLAEALDAILRELQLTRES
jgi:hypothetical protein